MDFPVPDIEPLLTAFEVCGIIALAIAAFWAGWVAGGFCK